MSVKNSAPATKRSVANGGPELRRLKRFGNVMHCENSDATNKVTEE